MKLEPKLTLGRSSLEAIGGSRVVFQRGHRTTSTSFTTTQRMLGLNGSLAYSGAISYANATLTTANLMYLDSPFQYIRNPTLLVIEVISLFSASPGTFTVTIRKSSDGSSVEAITTTTSVGGIFTLTFNHNLILANISYYVTWSQTNSTNTSMALIINALI